MKIKRFEASTMAEALRMVKKEFGEEAVILSAKTQKKSGRMFRGQSGDQVVVTAAIDTAPPARNEAGSSVPKASADLDKVPGERTLELKPAYGINRILQHFTPITRTGQKKLQPKLIRLRSQAQDESGAPVEPLQDSPVFEQLREQGLAGIICDELSEQMTPLMQDVNSGEQRLSALSQIIEAKAWVAPWAPSRREAVRTIVLIGPHGVGKTTTAAKLAAHTVLNSGDPVALLSLDDQRIAGTTELQRYADIMGVQFESAADPKQVTAALDRMRQARLVVVDTPGLGPHDACGQASLISMLERLGPCEIHLLIHAGSQEQVMAGMIHHYKTFKIDRLLPTHVDWCRQFGPFINQMRRHHWPITYMGTGPQVPEGLRRLTARYLASLLLGQTTYTEPEEIKIPVNVVQRATHTVDSGRYVASRNSDIFHERTCKSVARISEDHALIFQDTDDAIDQGFKPCRKCCMAHFVSKPIERRENKYVAGSRN
jgi:flagellar biosynthesis protein FlhF